MRWNLLFVSLLLIVSGCGEEEGPRQFPGVAEDGFDELKFERTYNDTRCIQWGDSLSIDVTRGDDGYTLASTTVGRVGKWAEDPECMNGTSGPASGTCLMPEDGPTHQLPASDATFLEEQIGRIPLKDCSETVEQPSSDQEMSCQQMKLTVDGSSVTWACPSGRWHQEFSDEFLGAVFSLDDSRLPSVE